MTQSGRQEIIRRLAEDYATRAAVLKLKFEDAYNMYVKRCEIRDDDNLLQQYTCANLGRLPTKTIDRQEEYIITTTDDDCEDGVCKL
jgi:hypothetical protein|tara:strand:- start:415 stop:675 length:261 start_codon:yes stop_codon:yes gene_type:complete